MPGTAATLGARSVVEGSILAGSAITFGTKSRVNGCVLAQTAITFETAGTVSLPDPPPPQPAKAVAVVKSDDSEDTLASITGGPNLRAPWGLSVFSRRKGYSTLHPPPPTLHPPPFTLYPKSETRKPSLYPNLNPKPEPQTSNPGTRNTQHSPLN